MGISGAPEMTELSFCRTCVVRGVGDGVRGVWDAEAWLGSPALQAVRHGLGQFLAPLCASVYSSRTGESGVRTGVNELPGRKGLERGAAQSRCSLSAPSS